MKLVQSEPTAYSQKPEERKKEFYKTVMLTDNYPFADKQFCYQEPNIFRLNHRAFSRHLVACNLEQPANVW